MAVLEAIEGVGNAGGVNPHAKDKERPLREIKLLAAVVFNSPLREAEQAALESVRSAILARKQKAALRVDIHGGVKRKTMEDEPATAAGELGKVQQGVSSVTPAPSARPAAPVIVVDEESRGKFMKTEGVRVQEDLLAASKTFRTSGSSSAAPVSSKRNNAYGNFSMF